MTLNAYKPGHRPHSLKEVVRVVNAGEDKFSFALSEFIDETKKMDPAALADALKDDPEFVDETNPSYAHWQNAYLGATAEHLCRIAKIPIPEWTEKRERFLNRAWFANSGLTSLNAMLLAESPLSFRRRMIFTEAKPLRRA